MREKEGKDKEERGDEGEDSGQSEYKRGDKCREERGRKA